MLTYLKLGKVRGLCIEIQGDFGSRPFFQKNTFNYETIVDIPYAQITYTSSKWIPLRSASNVNEKAHQTKKRTSGA